MFGPAHWTDTPLVSAASQAERREHGDTDALGEAEIEGEISQSRGESEAGGASRGRSVCLPVCAAFGRLQRLERVCVLPGVWYFETDFLLKRRWRK